MDDADKDTDKGVYINQLAKWFILSALWSPLTLLGPMNFHTIQSERSIVYTEETQVISKKKLYYFHLGLHCLLGNVFSVPQKGSLSN